MRSKPSSPEAGVAGVDTDWKYCCLGSAPDRSVSPGLRYSAVRLMKPSLPRGSPQLPATDHVSPSVTLRSPSLRVAYVPSGSTTGAPPAVVWMPVTSGVPLTCVAYSPNEVLSKPPVGD